MPIQNKEVRDEIKSDENHMSVIKLRDRLTLTKPERL